MFKIRKIPNSFAADFLKADWDESKHPRSPDGKFDSGDASGRPGRGLAPADRGIPERSLRAMVNRLSGGDWETLNANIKMASSADGFVYGNQPREMASLASKLAYKATDVAESAYKADAIPLDTMASMRRKMLLAAQTMTDASKLSNPNPKEFARHMRTIMQESDRLLNIINRPGK